MRASVSASRAILQARSSRSTFLLPLNQSKNLYSSTCPAASSSSSAHFTVSRDNNNNNNPTHSTMASNPIPGDHMKEGMGLPATSKQMTFTNQFFKCERGDILQHLTLGYNTYGTLNESGDNCVIVGHSLTSNSCVDEWWKELIGPGPKYTLDTMKYFIVCANYLGSVYGSSSPLEYYDAADDDSGNSNSSRRSNDVPSSSTSENKSENTNTSSIPASSQASTMSIAATRSSSSSSSRRRRRYGADFPIPTIRDNVRAQRLLLDRLGVNKLAFAIGGSLGGMLALEWVCTYPAYVGKLILVATCARHTAWAIGLGEVERQAIFADSNWKNGYYDPLAPAHERPLAGMSVARQFAMLSYRTPQSFTEKFARTEKKESRLADVVVAQGNGYERGRLAAAEGKTTAKKNSSSAHSHALTGAGGNISAAAAEAEALMQVPHYEVEGYLTYQGEKFIKRFDPLSYVRLTQLLDSHDVGGGGRKKNQQKTTSGSSSSSSSSSKSDDDYYQTVLRSIPHQTLVVGIDSDLLYPLSLQHEMAHLLPRSSLYVISSPHGHDSFLIEIKQLNDVCTGWLAGRHVPGLVTKQAVATARL